MTEYQPPYRKNGTYLQIETSGQEYRSYAPEFYLLDDDGGEITAKFFERLGNPTYNLGPETYHDSGYNSYTVNHGFTIPNSSKFRFREPKSAKFNELACPVDNQRRCHAYFLCYGIEPQVHTHQFIGGRVLIRQGEQIFGLPWDFGVLSVENVTRVEFVDKNLIGERTNTWDDSQVESSGEDYILLQDAGANNLFPSKFDASIYIFEVSDRTSNPGTFSPIEPTESSETLSTRYNSPIAHSTAVQHNISPLNTDEDAANDLNENLFLTVHPATASEMSSGEKTDMYHLANGYFGKGSFYHKPGLKMLPHQFVGDFNINTTRDSIQRFNTPQEYGIYIQNQDEFLEYAQDISCDITTDGFKWVENLLSEPETAIHSSQYTASSGPPKVTQNIAVRTLLGEHHWWDTTASSNSGAVSSDPFFRVTGTGQSLDGTAKRHLEKSYPALIAYSRSIRKKPITAQVAFNITNNRWKRNLRDFCIRTNRFPETLYFRFDNYALNPKTMIAFGEEQESDSGSDGNRQYMVAPGFDPVDLPTREEKDHAKYSMLEVDIVPMNTDIFPTSLPIMWSNQAFQFFYDKATGLGQTDEATAINRLQNSVLDYGYDVIAVGEDYYDNTNTVTTNYPFAFSGDEYSKVFRENSTKLISSYSEWVFPLHLTELPATASDYQNLLCFAVREPTGHRLIISNISCVV